LLVCFGWSSHISEERKKTKAEMTATERRDEKKRKLKETFNAQYDVKDDSEFYDSWKAETEQQAKVNNYI
jgi:ribosome biogenesis protein BMS1